MYVVNHYHNNPKNNSEYKFGDFDDAISELESYVADDGRECSHLECPNGDWAKYLWATQETEWHKAIKK